MVPLEVCSGQMQEAEVALHLEEADLEPQAWGILRPLRDLFKTNSQGFVSLPQTGLLRAEVKTNSSCPLHPAKSEMVPLRDH